MENRDEIIRFLRILFSVGDVFEIRVLNAVTARYRDNPHAESGYFDYEHIPQAADSILALRDYSGAYVTLNPVNPALLARANNRLVRAKNGNSTADCDIMEQRWLPIDCDPVRPAGISSTEEEHAAAHDLAREIRKGLAGLGWPEPIVLDSGNGAQMLYKVCQLPDQTMIQKAIAEIAKADTDRVKVDLTVFNAARIWRIPGTMNRKGDSIPNRPHRLASIVSAPLPLACVEAEQIFSVISADCGQNEHASSFSQAVSCFDADAWIREHCPDLGEPKSWNGGRKWLFKVCPFNPNHDNGSAVLIQSSSGAMAFRCHHNGCKGNDWHTLRALLEPGCYDHPAVPDMDWGALTSPGKRPQEPVVHALTPKPDPAPISRESDDPPEVREQDLSESLVETLPFPEHLYKIPGLVGDIMETTLKFASTPNRPLALSGALAMMSYLTARKVKSPSGLRTNIYILALAVSGSGKERPRDINQIIAEETRLADGLLDGVASGAGLEDMLAINPSLLWQCDEFYSTLEEMLREKNDCNNTVMEKLLKMYTSAHKTYKTRAKAGKQPQAIPCPHMVLYATTTPNGFFDHVNDRFLADGMYARLSVMVAEKTSAGHLPVEPEVPLEIIERARAWAQYRPAGSGNCGILPLSVPYTADAAPMAEALFRKQQEKLAEMHKRNEPEWKCSIWNRYCEISLRYALIYACSVAPTPDATVITPDAIRWGGEFVEWEMNNKLYMTDRNYFKTEFSRLQDIALTGLRRWHKEKGLGTPMPGWRFNRLLDGQPPNVIKAVAGGLLDQEKMFDIRVGRGHKYSLKRFDKN